MQVANHLSLMFAAQADIDELEHLISQYQQIEDDEQGDLLDDFVLSATLVRFRLCCRQLRTETISLQACAAH